MVAQTSGPALETWIQAAAALFTAIAAGAAWAATRQVKATNEEERRLRITAHLKTIHGLVSELAMINPNDPARLQGPQLRLRAEVTLVFHPLPKCSALTSVNVWEVEAAALQDLLRDAMAEVETALGDVWIDVRRWSWFRRRPVASRIYPPPESEAKTDAD